MMLLKRPSPPSIWGVVVVTICAAYALGGESSDEASIKRDGKSTVVEPTTVDSEESEAISVTAARKQAILMHAIYTATLEVMHHHYFHENKAILPARAMEDIFAELAEESKIKSNWISVNTNAMSVHHEPKTDFEIKAAAELRTGKETYEAVEKGYYYRAGPIALGAGCVSCHTGFFTPPGKTPRFAGLIVGIPLEEE